MLLFAGLSSSEPWIGCSVTALPLPSRVRVSETEGTGAVAPNPLPYRTGVSELTRKAVLNWSVKPEGVPANDPGTTCKGATLKAAELGPVKRNGTWALRV